MRVVICADAHLDSVFPVFRKNAAKTQTRREEQKLAFSKAVDEVKRTDAHLLLLPGDLFCAKNVSQETLDFLAEAFRSIPNTFVLIAPGNHDPILPDSPYHANIWPENVYIFKKELEALELSYDDTGETVRVYGAAFNGHFCRSSLLRNNNTLPILDRSVLNLLVMHGNITDADGKSDYNPIYKEDIDACGFDLCALGHVHRYSGILKAGNATYVYPGTCEGRNFEETGTCGILSGSVTKEGMQLEFIPTSVRENHIVEVDISGLETYEQLLNAIRGKCVHPEWLYKVILRGKKHKDICFALNALAADISENYFYFKLSAEYEVDTGALNLKDENSLRGFFVRCMLEQIEAAAPEDKDVYNKAMQYGLQAFEGEVLFHDNP